MGSNGIFDAFGGEAPDESPDIDVISVIEDDSAEQPQGNPFDQPAIPGVPEDSGPEGAGDGQSPAPVPSENREQGIETGTVYITVNLRNVKLKLDAKDQATLKATLAGGDALDPEGFMWWADDYHIVNATFLTDTARIESAGVSGVTSVHVKHPKAREAVDIVVMVSAFESFVFDSNSKTIKKGSIAFIPLRAPPSTEQTRVEYSSANPAVCAITASNAVAMIAGITDGYTTVTASLKAGTTVIAVAEMAVIVFPVVENQVRITTKSTVLNMEIGASLTVEAVLQGAGVSHFIFYDIVKTHHLRA